jgi:hypothetical protein
MAFAAKTWYFGWLGEMRPLLTPKVGLTNTDERYGGVHQSLNGARTVDTTGLRRTYAMNWDNLTDAELAWLYAFYRRMIYQPSYLIDPMKKNLMSEQSSTNRIHGIDDIGIFSSISVVREWRNDYPTGPNLLGDRVPIIVSTGVSGGYVRFDGSTTWIPATIGEPITYSVYMKCDTGTVSLSMVADWCDKFGTELTGTFVGKTVTTTWQRFSITVTPTGSQAGMRPAIVFPTGTINVRLAAPQAEYGSSATAWEQGGGKSKVMIDQISSESGRYPLNNVDVTFLEA